MNNTPSIGHNTQIAAYDPIRDKVKDIVASDKALNFDYEDKADNKAARSHVAGLRKERAALDEIRKGEKEESLERGRLIDSEASVIRAELTAIIDVHANKLQAIKEADDKRVEGHKQRILVIESHGQAAKENWDSLPMQMLENTLVELIGTKRIDVWDEYEELACMHLDAAVASVKDAIEKKAARETELAELETLRQATAEREAADAVKAEEDRVAEVARLAAVKATEDAEAEAEAERLAADAKVEADKVEAARASQSIIDTAEAATIEARLQAERAETRALNAEAAARQKAADDAEAERIEAVRVAEIASGKTHKRDINRAALKGLTDGGIGLSQGREVLVLIASGKVPHVTIDY